jgi:hypothetical protein
MEKSKSMEKSNPKQMAQKMLILVLDMLRVNRLAQDTLSRDAVDLDFLR